MTYQFYSAKKLLSLVEKYDKTIPEIMLLAEGELTNRTPEEIRKNMGYRLGVMRQAIEDGLADKRLSRSEMAGGDSVRMIDMDPEDLFISPVMQKAIAYGLAVMEGNARMGVIVAAPTAGSSGIIPGLICGVQDVKGYTDDQAIDGLLAASAVGMVIAHKATFSAAAAGCQAEIGSSSAMAAGALSAMRGLSAEQCLNAAAISLKNMIGLACDPIGGFVEVPCVKRNGIGIAHAITASDMSAAQIYSNVPFDEVVQAMNNVAKNMHPSIRETSTGGLAITETGKQIAMGKTMSEIVKGRKFRCG